MGKTSIAAYTDIIPVLDKATESETPLYILFESFGKAVNFRQRSYTYRARLRAQRSKLAPIGIEASTPYDTITIDILDKKGNKIHKKADSCAPDEEHRVKIYHKSPKSFKILDEEGNVVDVTVEKPLDFDPIDLDGINIDLEIGDDD